jgi:hypothetical protein
MTSSLMTSSPQRVRWPRHIAPRSYCWKRAEAVLLEDQRREPDPLVFVDNAPAA